MKNILLSKSNATSLLNHKFPKRKVKDFDCSFNLLTNLVGSPHDVYGRFDCSHNNLSSLVGVPKYTGDFRSRGNPNLIDVSDLWNSEISFICHIDINPDMSVLPLLKFILDANHTQISIILRKHYGSDKQNIIDCQYDLIDNGFEKNAGWKPL